MTPPIAAQRKATVLVSGGKVQVWGRSHFPGPFPGAMTFYDSNLLIVVPQLSLAEHYLGVILKNTESYPQDSVGQR